MTDDVHLDAVGRPRIIEMKFIVEEACDGWRVDHYLKHKIARLSRTRLQEVIRTQLVGPGGRAMKPHATVHAGDALVIRRPARREPPSPRTFGVLYQDAHLLVIDKPAGLAMHASARYYFNTLTALLRERFPGEPLQIAHRLDRETSGCVVVARGREAGRALKQAFERRAVEKVYAAIVYGAPPWVGGDGYEIRIPLELADERVSRLGIRMVPAAHDDETTVAVTHVRVVSVHGPYTLVACRPLTGRQHQIRAHLAAVGFPIVGDKLYAHGDDAFAQFCDEEVAEPIDESMPNSSTGDLLAARETRVAARFGLPRHALHAAAVTFPHPANGAPLTVESPLPADLTSFLDGAH